jgi:hypothetical protein
MKKNATLIAQVARSASASRKDAFKVTCKNANRYANKILVDSEQFNQPGVTEAFIRAEMQDYRPARLQHNRNATELSGSLRRKAERRSIEDQLNHLERNFNPLYLEELMSELRSARKEEVLEVRNKLTKLEMSLSFRLENEDCEPHMQ